MTVLVCDMRRTTFTNGYMVPIFWYSPKCDLAGEEYSAPSKYDVS